MDLETVVKADILAREAPELAAALRQLIEEEKYKRDGMLRPSVMRGIVALGRLEEALRRAS